jgi:enoyl-CoA hydratase/carnithine racemase
MPYETFLIERSGSIATVYFNRLEKLDPIDEKVMREILAITEELREDDTSRVVILTGKGWLFCVGADLNVLSASVNQEKQQQQIDAARLRSAKLGGALWMRGNCWTRSRLLRSTASQ